MLSDDGLTQRDGVAPSIILRLRVEGALAVSASRDHAEALRLDAQGAENLVLRSPLTLPQTRILHGTADEDVPQDVPLRLLAHATGDIRLTLVKGADHRFSSPDCLALIEATVAES